MSDGGGGRWCWYSREYGGYRELIGQVLSNFFLFRREKMKVMGSASGFVGGQFFVVVI